MNLTAFLNEAYEDLKCDPNVLSVFQPRKILPPDGYHSPNRASAALYQMMAVCAKKFRTGPAPDSLELASFSTVYRILNYKVQTYFVGEDLCRALAVTQPPSEFNLEDLSWPVPGMILCFPLKFMQEYIGSDISHVFCAHIPAGSYQGPLPGCPTIECPTTRMAVGYWIETGGGMGTRMSIYRTEDKLGGLFDRYSYTDFTGKASAEEIQQEREQLNKVVALTIKLLLVYAAQPALVAHGSLVAKARTKKGREIPEQWAPNFIGERYVYHRREPTGTHASPGVHWRTRHIRIQRHGPQNSLRKVLWIEGTWIGIKDV